MFRFLFVMLLMGCSVAAQPAESAPPHKEAVAMPLTTLNAFLSTYYADVGSSVQLRDGRVLWLFGDTWRPAAQEVYSNTAVVQTATGEFIERPGTFLTPADADYSDTWYWPGQAVAPGREHIYVLMQQFVRTGPGAWDWHYEGTDLVTLRQADLSVKRVSRLPASPQQAMWSQMFYEEKSGQTYVYGSYQEGSYQKGYDALVTDSLTSPQWTVKSRVFSPDLELGTVASVAQVGTGDYRLYSKRLDMWSNEIIMYRGASPLGPWSDRQVVAITPTDAGCWSYAAEAHSHLAVLTYATNCGAFDTRYHLTAIPMTV